MKIENHLDRSDDKLEKMMGKKRDWKLELRDYFFQTISSRKK